MHRWSYTNVRNIFRKPIGPTHMKIVELIADCKGTQCLYHTHTKTNIYTIIIMHINCQTNMISPNDLNPFEDSGKVNTFN